MPLICALPSVIGEFMDGEVMTFPSSTTAKRLRVASVDHQVVETLGRPRQKPWSPRRQLEVDAPLPGGLAWLL